MSSPIAVFTTQREQLSPNMNTRSLPGSNASGLYVPVHRRGASTSSTTSSTSLSERASISLHPRSRKRHLDVSPMRSPRQTAMNIPPSSNIPNTYTLAELLALSSFPAPLSTAQRAQVDAHVLLMTRKPTKPKATPPSALSPSSSSSASASSSTAPSTVSSPSQDPVPLPTIIPVPTPSPAHASAPRRRRPRRQNSGGKKPRVVPAVGTDVENRRRGAARHGATWGWAAHAQGNGVLPEGPNWRARAFPAVPAAAAAVATA